MVSHVIAHLNSQRWASVRRSAVLWWVFLLYHSNFYPSLWERFLHSDSVKDKSQRHIEHWPQSCWCGKACPCLLNSASEHITPVLCSPASCLFPDNLYLPFQSQHSMDHLSKTTPSPCALPLILSSLWTHTLYIFPRLTLVLLESGPFPELLLHSGTLCLYI